MDKAIYKTARGILDKYLESGVRRKTPERYMMLEIIYSINGIFQLYELQTLMEKKKMYISRATLYNNMKLFVQLRLVNRYKQEGETKYEASLLCKNRCMQICTCCGKVSEVEIRSLPALKNNIALNRFRGESYSITIYGICSSCVAKQTRQLKKEEMEKKKMSKLQELKKLVPKSLAKDAKKVDPAKKGKKPTTKSRKDKTIKKK